ncbi:hypothetical protein CCP4SC76_140002 [Gammaproteobacteria bacterium]
MPKISELPGNAGLTGAELIPIVQGGETRKVNLGELANMSVPPSIRGIRWFHDSEGGFYLALWDFLWSSSIIYSMR